VVLCRHSLGITVHLIALANLASASRLRENAILHPVKTRGSRTASTVAATKGGQPCTDAHGRRTLERCLGLRASQANRADGLFPGPPPLEPTQDGPDTVREECPEFLLYPGLGPCRVVGVLEGGEGMAMLAEMTAVCARQTTCKS
jgi:hypothetical protein